VGPLSSRRRTTPHAAIAAIGLLALAAPAAATIVPGEGMAGVSLRMTAGEVRGRLGAPERIRTWHGALGTLVTRFRYAWGDVDLEALRPHAPPVVIRLSTSRVGEKTASGVGVGSSLSIVGRLHAVRCWWEGPTTIAVSGGVTGL